MIHRLLAAVPAVLASIGLPLPASAVATRSGEEGAGPPPSFVLVVADDLGYSDLGCTWVPTRRVGYEANVTPRIDRMAEEACASPTSTPRRRARPRGPRS